MVQRYLSRISGPLLDRIDLHVEVTPVAFKELTDSQQGEKSAVIRTRVIEVRKIQQDRFKGLENLHSNAQMSSRLVRQYCKLDEASRQLIKVAMERLGLSARAYDRILRVARTIADMDGATDIQTQHIAEAIHFRSLDRENWGG